MAGDSMRRHAPLASRDARLSMCLKSPAIFIEPPDMEFFSRRANALPPHAPITAHFTAHFIDFSVPSC